MNSFTADVFFIIVNNKIRFPKITGFVRRMYSYIEIVFVHMYIFLLDFTSHLKLFSESK